MRDPRSARILLVDHYDSYTFNVYALLARHLDVAPTVVASDLPAEELQELLAQRRFDGIVLSPVPGNPEIAADAGWTRLLIRHNPTVPILGVCFGFQALCVEAGLKVERLEEPVHGQVHQVGLHCDALRDEVFGAGHPERFDVVRYHSLHVLRIDRWNGREPGRVIELAHARPPMPDSSHDDGRSREPILMAIRIEGRPHWGVQYHPEAVCSQSDASEALIRNWLAVAVNPSDGHIINVGASDMAPTRARASSDGYLCNLAPKSGRRAAPSSARSAQRGLSESCGQCRDVLTAVPRLIAHLGRSAEPFVVLDSARPLTNDHGRFAIFASAQFDPAAIELTYDVSARILRARSAAALPSGIAAERALGPEENIYEALRGILLAWGATPEQDGEPFPGLLGVFSCELYAEPKAVGSGFSLPAAARGEASGGAWLLTSRIVEADLVLGRFRCVDFGSGWPGGVQQVEELLAAAPGGSDEVRGAGGCDAARPQFACDTPDCEYEHMVDECKRHIRNGDSYELCLTTRHRAATKLDAHEARIALTDAFLHLRQRNAAPYACILSLASVTLLSSSPERMLKCERVVQLVNAEPCAAPAERARRPVTVAQCRPIKGTARRDLEDAESDRRIRDALERSVKDRAENMMIVDLCRNDLTLCSDPLSVCVPALMVVETYATVHQLVSYVEATLLPSADALDAVCVTFPAASMTGAPKRRSIQLLQQLEATPRGFYSGCVGWLDARLLQACDLAVVIRSVWYEADQLLCGAGGAVTILSSAVEEREEMWTKALATLRAAWPEAGAPPPAEPERPGRLMETLLWTGTAVQFAEEHAARLTSSAAALQLPLRAPVSAESLTQLVYAAAKTYSAPLRVRVVLQPSGEPRVDAIHELPAAFCPHFDQPTLGAALPTWRVRVDPRVSATAADDALRHKLTWRAAYTRARARVGSDVDDVLMHNDAGHVTETSIMNVFLLLETGELVTPPLADGVLPGVLRASVRCAEQATALAAFVALAHKGRAFCGNSVRGFCKLAIVD